MRNFAKDILFGISVGDALGVPFEFKNRENLKRYPATDMIGFGTHSQPKGTWSDDSSLSFCLADSLCDGYNPKSIANKFFDWFEEKIWTPHGRIFDIGIATTKALSKLENIKDTSVFVGGNTENDNGNGSLMRILPIVLYLKDKDINYRYSVIKEVSSITHAHFISIFSCFIYIEIALNLMNGFNKEISYKKAIDDIKNFITEDNFNNLNQNIYSQIQNTEDNINKYLGYFAKIFSGNIKNETEDNIKSTGYVLDSLEASLWCWLNTDNYKDSVLKAVNLGNDTDTIATITGGLASLTYGFENIPKEWVDCLAKKEDIENLANRLNNKF